MWAITIFSLVWILKIGSPQHQSNLPSVWKKKYISQQGIHKWCTWAKICLVLYFENNQAKCLYLAIYLSTWIKYINKHYLWNWSLHLWLLLVSSLIAFPLSYLHSSDVPHLQYYPLYHLPLKIITILKSSSDCGFNSCHQVDNPQNGMSHPTL